MSQDWGDIDDETLLAIDLSVAEDEYEDQKKDQQADISRKRTAEDASKESTTSKVPRQEDGSRGERSSDTTVGSMSKTDHGNEAGEKLMKQTNGNKFGNRAAGEGNPLQDIRGGYLWVSDFTKQNWCEQKMVYELTLPVLPVLEADMVEVTEKAAKAMNKGSDLHLIRELAVQDTVTVRVTSSEDIWAIKVINLLSAVKSFLGGATVRREIPVFGMPFEGIFIVGLIDEIRCDAETFDFDLLEFKTRSGSRTLPSKAQQVTHKLQVLLYRKLYDDLIRGKVTADLVALHLKLDLHKPFGEDVMKQIGPGGPGSKNLKELLNHTFDTMKSLPCISQTLIEYCYQDDQSTIGIVAVENDEKWLQGMLKYYSAYWKGQREVAGVDIEDAWKCQRCEFADVCEWREKKAQECAQKNLCKT